MPTLLALLVTPLAAHGLRCALGAAAAALTELHAASDLLEGALPPLGGRRPPRSCTNPLAPTNTGTGTATCDPTEANNDGTVP